jgi:DNA-binding cell septation regulator SpoVG
MKKEDVTEVRVSVPKGSANWKGTLGLATVSFSIGIDVNGFAIRQGKDGLWVSFPSAPPKQNDPEGKWRPYFWVQNKEERSVLTDQIIAAYLKEVKGSGSQPSQGDQQTDFLF